MFDPAYRRTPQLTRGIHDYFLAKSLDVVRPGGLIALITSRYTMDKQDSAVREHLADGAVLLGALRLPNTAFKANAGTDVTTDVLFLQKRSSGVRQEGEQWAQLAPIDTPDGKLQINEYFVRHPEMMLGRIRSKLVAAGVPPKEVAFIHDAETDTAKKLLFDGVNAGTVRILLGSTEKMGAGTNVQRRLVALHHLDAPWRPRDIEQREGRILRQGNTNKEVQIYRYVTEGSFDAYMWQTLETKARFIHQVMRGETSVRSAEDLDSGALTYAEIKAIASGNPAVVEKIKIDTEIRKLDQLRAVHANQQRHIRWEIRDLPRHIADTKQRLADMEGDIELRNSTEGADFTMTVGNRVYSGKGARDEAAKALTFAILSWRDDQTMQPRGQFRGFEILSKGRSGGFGLLQNDERVPELFIRGRATYSANLSSTNPVGTVQSIEHTLRSLDKLAADQRGRMARADKELVDYQAQADRPFEHEERLKQLLARQSELNSQLDLDKGDQQGADSVLEIGEDLERRKAVTTASGPAAVAKMAEAYMRASGRAIREMPVLQRTPPPAGLVSGKAVAKDDLHVALATSANRFIVVELGALGRDVQVGERLRLNFSEGRPSLDTGHARER